MRREEGGAGGDGEKDIGPKKKLEGNKRRRGGRIASCQSQNDKTGFYCQLKNLKFFGNGSDMIDRYLRRDSGLSKGKIWNF